tara:strand:- start:797 stop:940 length:144 start_codon:yes stop_codon:yes gene_type:complete
MIIFFVQGMVLMEITDDHHDGEANDQVLYRVKVTILLIVGQSGACDV